MERLDQALIPLERAIGMIPADRLQERPVADARTIGELIHHIYNVLQVTILGVKFGKYHEEDGKDLPDSIKTLRSKDALLSHARSVRAWIRETAAGLGEEQVSQQVTFHFGDFEAQAYGIDALNYAYMELLHHRGQVHTLLRLIGIQPPDIYDVQE